MGWRGGSWEHPLGGWRGGDPAYAPLALSLVSATVGADGETLTLVFDRAVTLGADALDGLTLTLTGGAVTATYTSGDETDTLVCALSRVVQSSETGTLAYTPQGDGIMEFGEAAELGEISGFTITNNSTQSPPGIDIDTLDPWVPGEIVQLNVTGLPEGGTLVVRWSPSSDPDNAYAVNVTVDATDITDGDGTIDVTAARGNVRYGVNGYVTVRKDGLDSNALAIEQEVEAGFAYVNLTDPLADSGERLQSIEDLEPGDQIAYGNVVGTGVDITDLAVNPDGSIEAAEAIESFDFGVHDGIEWGDFETQALGEEDTTAPTVSSAVIDSAGTSLTITFTEPVNFGAGGNGGFALSLSGAGLTYASGAGSSALVYSIARTIGSHETATLAYTQPGNGVEDESGNDLATFSGQSVTNDSTADTVAPTVTSRTINSAGTQLSIGVSEAVTFGAGGNGGFAVTLSGGAATLSYVSGDETSTLVYALSRVVAPGETGTLAYTQPGNGVEDLAGNDLATFSGQTITNNSSADVIAPLLLSVELEDDGETLMLTFSETVVFGAGGNGGFTITPSGGAATLTYDTGSGTDTLVYTTSRLIASHETLTLSYTQPGNGVEDESGNDLASLGPINVANASDYLGPPIFVGNIGTRTARIGRPFTFNAGSVAYWVGETAGAVYTSEGDALPSWASLDADTGIITGTPDDLTPTLYTGIVIRKTVGMGSDDTNAFGVYVREAGSGQSAFQFNRLFSVRL